MGKQRVSEDEYNTESYKEEGRLSNRQLPGLSEQRSAASLAGKAMGQGILLSKRRISGLEVSPSEQGVRVDVVPETGYVLHEKNQIVLC